MNSYVYEPVLENHLHEDHLAAALRADVLTGLGGAPKSLPPRWFYDARGSELFEQITTLPEYYQTRLERGILRTRAAEVAELTAAATLSELGSGSSEKTRLLLDALHAAGSLRKYVALDVSETALRDSTGAIARDYPSVQVHGVVGDFTKHLDLLPATGPRLIAFLGSTIGNLLPDERIEFLASVRDTLNPGEWLLLGTDLVKDPDPLVRAYADAAGTTAEFNRNVLRVLNRELGANFDIDSFDHVALWDAEHDWIEMRLRATRNMLVQLTVLDTEVRFDTGEELRTEISAKFRPERLQAELADTGFELTHLWTDPDNWFGLSLARAV
ncbi:L-histidine N(alpha)-methyltransferase [Nocardia sp. NPDC052566]|uniref:L-histidine N(alpha)-methyltransferase n=1 Tax=Nocardia sp. NPDC052566 TaxID=3364330 RepID=UPI0037CC0801